MSTRSKALEAALAYEPGDPSGPYCPYCNNARADQRANPETFDIFDHVRACMNRIRTQENE